MSIFFSLGRLSRGSVHVWGFFNTFVISSYFYREELIAPRPTTKLEDHPLSTVRDCLFNIFAASLQTWRASPPSATWRRAMPWWQGLGHSEELHNLYSSPSIIRMIKSRRMRWAGHVARMERRGMHIGHLWESQKDREHWVDHGVGGGQY
jgi:hypothetical protein